MGDNRRDSLESHTGISIATIIERKERQWEIENVDRRDRYSMATTESLTPSRSTSLPISSTLSTHTPDPESYKRGRSEFGGDDALSSRYYLY